MNLGQKFRKLSRFLSLCLALSLGAAFFALPAFSAITSGKKKCLETFASELKSFSKSIDVMKLDPESRCSSSGGADNHKISEEPAQRKKLKLSQGEETGTSFEWACHSSYESVQRVFEKLLESRQEVCEQIYTELDEKFPDCLGNKPPESCKEQMRAMTEIYTKGNQRLQKDIDTSTDFLKKYASYAAEAKEKFKKDLDQLQFLTRTENRTELLAAAATPPEARRKVVAADQGSATLGEYLAKLEIRKNGLRTAASKVSGGALPAASPIDEQEEAKKFVDAFSEKLKSLKKKESTEFSTNLAAFRESLRNKNDSAAGNIQDRLTKIAPVAAPLAGSLMNGSSAASSVAAGSSGALPALAMVGAAGAAGMALGQKSASGSSASSSLAGTGSRATNSIDTTPSTNLAGGKEGSTATALGAAAYAEAAATGSGEKEEAEFTPSSGGGSDAAAIGGGASVMPAGAASSKADREVASTAASASAEDNMMKPFTGDLRPAPRPSSSSESAGNDVSNLLGKMKDLFNLDESFGSEGPPPHMSASGGGPIPSGNAPATDEYPNEDYASGEGYQAEAESSGEEDLERQGSNPMGNFDVTLFRRVNNRHMKCIEKGLVVLMPKGLPE